jgi:hypothetical protein
VATASYHHKQQTKDVAELARLYIEEALAKTKANNI